MKGMCILCFLITMCAQTGRTQGIDDNLAARGREVAESVGVAVWQSVASDASYGDRDGEFFREVTVFSRPQRVSERLCKSRTYLYHHFTARDEMQWVLIDGDSKGFTSVSAAVLDDSSVACDDVPLSQFFNAHDRIEDATLVSLYLFVDNAIASRSIDVDPDNSSITAIYLSQRPGYLASFAYKAAISTNGRQEAFIIEVELDEARFSLGP